ncbi:carboxypeptidase-like regulatory domain-containing protein [Muricauda sp. SCSIO 64092]|uniref:carboxypeptidase-like regulatory domain-containing protein n=1 Tax=Allomuricauda sp. SCSIO 64092 TaxID=2908842 RepID=UPI001FF25D35|nr:carboxypeptidase-like regulatory domain-containing protein [Muricauda sp. SCSIO 64092]UOY05234.1 carboxypeptidase-like regulatory domain-containing protein [Muricauda sp. SCSIO 64092]
MKIVSFVCFMFFLSLQINAQTFSSKLIDAKTKQGIPYATIQYAENRGVVTNEEGRFSFTLEAQNELLDSIYISSMGYEKMGFTLEQLQDSIIFIKPKAIQLGGVYVFDKELSVDDIIEQMKERLSQNVNNEPVKQRYFLRQSVFGTVQKVDMGFEKSSIAELDKELIDSIARAIPKSSYHYTETLGDFLKNNEAYKVSVLKAAELYNKNDVNSIEDLGQRMEKIFKANVKPDSYLKIKSGLFSQKIQVDSVLQEIDQEAEATIENEIQRDTISGLVDGQKFIFDEILGEVFYQEDSKLDIIPKTRKYEFELVGYSDIGESGVYVIDFSPKGKTDFRGRLYINIEDFAVMQIDFENLKNLRNFRLLGIYYRETLYKGTMRFNKLPNNRYELVFMDFNFGRWFRMDRPLDVIEKNKNVKGRRKQNELRLNIDFQIANTNKWELVVYENELIGQTQFENFKEDKSLEATYLPKYDPEFWKGYNIVEPNQAIREFTAGEEQD